MTDVATDLMWLERALDLARESAGKTRPNPAVGCVLVDPHRNVPIAWGAHEKAGTPHAEANALSSAGQAATGATAYVTLEPCNHTGQTPPCAQALIAARVSRVVFGTSDPNPTAHGGTETLRAAKIAVDGPAELRLRAADAVASSSRNDPHSAGLAARLEAFFDAALELNAPFFSVMIRRRPWVVAKWAMSLDGRIATDTGDSRWITGEMARADAHYWRARLGAVAVGSQTALTDDPALTYRGVDARFMPPTRIVFDGRARLPLDSQLIRTIPQAPLIVVTRADAPADTLAAWRAAGAAVVPIVPSSPVAETERPGGVDVAAALPVLSAEFGVQGVLLEGGASLLGSAFDAGIVDAVVVYVAPTVIGGHRALSAVGGRGTAMMADATRIPHLSLTPFGSDFRLAGPLRRPSELFSSASASTPKK